MLNIVGSHCARLAGIYGQCFSLKLFRYVLMYAAAMFVERALNFLLVRGTGHRCQGGLPAHNHVTLVTYQILL